MTISVSPKLKSWYFDWVYLPSYDYTVTKLSPYQSLHKNSLDYMSMNEGASALVIGVGPGQDVVNLRLRNKDKSFSVSAIDLSRQGLMRTRRKAAKVNQGVDTLQMDAQHLSFGDGRFDRVLSLHTMDFLEDIEGATDEIMRVLKKNGEFVVSYPAGRGSAMLASSTGSSIAKKISGGHFLMALQETFAGIGAALVYFPLAFTVKPQGGFYSRASLEQMIAKLGLAEYTIIEDKVYQDLIVWGKKSQ